MPSSRRICARRSFRCRITHNPCAAWSKPYRQASGGESRSECHRPAAGVSLGRLPDDILKDELHPVLRAPVLRQKHAVEAQSAEAHRIVDDPLNGLRAKLHAEAQDVAVPTGPALLGHERVVWRAGPQPSYQAASDQLPEQRVRRPRARCRRIRLAIRPHGRAEGESVLGLREDPQRSRDRGL